MFLFAGGAFYQYIMGVVISRYQVFSSGEHFDLAYKAAFTVPLIGLLVGVILFMFFREETSAKHTASDHYEKIIVFHCVCCKNKYKAKDLLAELIVLLGGF